MMDKRAYAASNSCLPIASLAAIQAWPREPRVNEIIHAMSARLVLAIAAIMGALAVAAGAFGAHALKSRVGPELIAVWQTAVLYQAMHALALLAVGLLLMMKGDSAVLRLAAWLFIAGIVLFSGSLYALALGGSRLLGPVTPIGGVAMIAGWLTFAWAAWRMP